MESLEWPDGLSHPEAVALHDPDLARSGFDLDPAVPERDFEGIARLQVGLVPDGFGEY